MFRLQALVIIAVTAFPSLAVCAEIDLTYPFNLLAGVFTTEKRPEPKKSFKASRVQEITARALNQELDGTKQALVAGGTDINAASFIQSNATAHK